MRIFDFFLFWGSGQAVLIALLILLKSNKNSFKLNIAMSVYIQIFSYAVLKGLYLGSEYYLTQPSLLFIPLYYTLGAGPVFYIYISLLYRKSYSFKGWQLLHLFPAFVQFCYYLIIFLKPARERISYFQTEYFFVVLPIEDILGLISFAVYTIMAHWIFIRHQQSVSAKNMEAGKRIYRSIGVAILGTYSLLITWTGLFIYDFFFTGYTLSYTFYYSIYVLIIMVTYTIIYHGFFDTSIIQPGFIIKSLNNSPILSEKEKLGSLEKLRQAMDKTKLFLRPKLTILEVAKEIGANPRELSQVLNLTLDKNFIDFVNEHRVDMAKLELLKEKNAHLTILAIGKLCGFNSNSSFNAVFKKHTSQTPTQFIKNNKKELR